jgi:hypothetical protein
MASTYSPSLKLELIGTGDQSGSWGNTTNNNLGTLLEQAIVGQYTVTMTNADFTLTDIDGTSDQARNAVIIISGNQNSAYSVICPAVQKLYMITNSLNSGATAYFKASGGTAISIANGNTILVYCTGTTIVPLNYVDRANSVANLTGGAATRIPYQTAVDTTGFIVAPTAGTFLRWNGSAYDWSSSTGSASTITGGAANQLLYQVGAGSTGFVTAPTSANVNLNWSGTAFNWVSNAGGTTAQSLTFNNSGTGGGSSQTFNGSTAITISYNTIGASPLAGSAFLTTTGTVTSGTWAGTLGAISGAALTNLTAANLVGSVPSATTATNQSGGTVNATSATSPTYYVGGASNYISQSSNEITFTTGGTQANKFTSQGLGTYNIGATGYILSTVGGYSRLGDNSVFFYNAACNHYNNGSSFGWSWAGNTIAILLNGGSNYNLTGTYGTISDERVKENITPARSYLSDLCKLEVIKYSLKKEESAVPTKLGFVAQQVEKVMPGLVEEYDNNDEGITDFKSVKTSIMIPMLVQAVQELKAGLDAANAEIAALKGA